MKENGYVVQEYKVPVKRYCQTMDLKDNPELIAEYVKRHSEAEAWPKSGLESVKWVFWKWRFIYWGPVCS